MTKLIKPPRVTPGSQGVAGTPGSPGSPPQPGYFIQEEYVIAGTLAKYIPGPPVVVPDPMGQGANGGFGPTRAQQYQADYDARTTQKLAGILGISQEDAAREYSGEAGARRALVNELVAGGMLRPQAELRADLMMMSDETRLYGQAGLPSVAFINSRPPSVGYRNVWVPPKPGIPPVRAVRAVPPTPGKEFGAAWDAGAMSVSAIAADGELTFAVSKTVVGAVCGLSNFDTGAHYSGITHGIYVSHGVARPVESGVFVGPSIVMVSEELQVVRRGSTVTYKVNGVACYTSEEPSYGEVFADAALFTASTDTISGASLEPRAAWAESHGALTPLETFASASGYMSSAGKMPALKGSSSGRVVVRVDAVLRPLTGSASNRAYGASTGALRPLVGDAVANEIRPTFGLAAGEMAALSGTSSGKTGTVGRVDGRLARLIGASSDRPYGGAEGQLRPLRGFSQDLVVDANALIVALGGFTLLAWGTTRAKNSAALAAPSPTAVAFAGAYFVRRAPKAALSITGLLPIMGRASIVAPAATLDASGATAAGGQIAGSMPHALVVAFAGAVGAANAPHAALAADGTQDTTGVANLWTRRPHTLSSFAGAVLTQRLPSPTVTTSAAVDTILSATALRAPAPVVTASGGRLIFGFAELWAPAPQLFTIPNIAILALPPVVLAALGGGTLAPWGADVGTGTGTGTGSTWAFGLGESERPGRGAERRYAASAYTNYPFSRIVRFAGHHYGIGATGLYRLDGDTDDGDPIAWAVQTQISDFGSSQLKAMPSTFFGAHMGPQAAARAVVGERDSHDYSYPNVRSTPIQNHRVAFGRGMRSRYYGVRLDDLAGGELHLDNIEPEIIELTRKR